ncbi:hypothetical protein C8Q74DRAFT_701909 [Fomes fomentarius]|nr:hypothetical protein C8Q74DRAFT_701909 [Fomes fomentarius]
MPSSVRHLRDENFERKSFGSTMSTPTSRVAHVHIASFLMLPIVRNPGRRGPYSESQTSRIRATESAMASTTGLILQAKSVVSDGVVCDRGPRRKQYGAVARADVHNDLCWQQLPTAVCARDHLAQFRYHGGSPSRVASVASHAWFEGCARASENACDRALARVISLASVRIRPLVHRAWGPTSVLHPSRTCARRRPSARIPTSLDEVSL